MNAAPESVSGGTPQPYPGIEFLWLEITGKCNLYCVHCYADSGPRATAGRMTTIRWLSLIDEASEMGVKSVQFIGGEPLLHPDIATLVRAARRADLSVEVYSNLTNVHNDIWDLFLTEGVSIATSFYSSNASSHEAITQRPGSYSRTVRNMERAVALNIPIRVGLIDVIKADPDGHDLEESVRFLADIGIHQIDVDRTRLIGRAIPLGEEPPDPVEELCGGCGDGRLAIDSLGDAYPCVFARWLPVGNVLEGSLESLLFSQRCASTVQELKTKFASRVTQSNEDSERLARFQLCQPCSPDQVCNPQGGCNPHH